MAGVELDKTVTADPAVHAVTAEQFPRDAIIAGRYTVRRFIAAGGMGEVYEADDRVLGTRVALKVVKPTASHVAVERLVRELTLARKVSHPNICRVHDVGEHEGRAFLTMELLAGETLADRLRRGPLDSAELDRIAPQLVAALSALHAAGIVHRDFKSSNVILADARVVVTDFGLARSATGGERDDARLTGDATLLGTPAYMAPEQVQGRDATPASDIYALGIVLYEMATGRLPFVEETALATATARLTRDPPPADTSPAWQAAIRRCLARDPGARPARVEDVLAQPRRGGRRRWLAGAVGVIGATAAVVAVRDADRIDEPAAAACESAARRLAGVWDEETKARTGARFAASSLAHVHDAWRSHAQQFDEYAAAWSTRWDAACASDDASSDPLLYGQRLTCLDAAFLELRSYAGGLADPAIDVEGFSLGTPGQFPIVPVVECDNIAVLRAQVPRPPPAQRARVDTLMAEYHRMRFRLRLVTNAGQSVDTAPVFARLDALRAELTELGYPSGAGDIGIWEALFLDGIRGDDSGLRLIDDLIELAERTRDDFLLARAIATRLMLHAHTASPAENAALLERATAVAARLGNPGSLMELIAEARTRSLSRSGPYAALLAAHEDLASVRDAIGLRSIALWERAHAAVLRSWNGEATRAAVDARQILDERERLTGAWHINLGYDLHELSVVFERAGQLAEALGAEERAIAIFEAARGSHAAPMLQDTHAAAFGYTHALGRTADADAHLRAAVADRGSAAYAKVADELRARGHRDAARYVVAAAVRDGADGNDVEAVARRLVDEVTEVLPSAPAAPPWPPTPAAADIMVRDGLERLAAGDPDGAIAALEQGLWRHGRCCGAAAVSAQDARFGLARALVATGGDRERARDLARDALGALAAMGPELDAKAAEIRNWLAAR